jgi:hypothetical protein
MYASADQADPNAQNYQVKRGKFQAKKPGPAVAMDH